MKIAFWIFVGIAVVAAIILFGMIVLSGDAGFLS